MAALQEDYRNGPWQGLPVLPGPQREYPAHLPPLEQWPPLIDETGPALDLVSERLAAVTDMRLPHPVEAATALHGDAHESLTAVWDNPFSERGNMHRGVLWKMAVVKFGPQGALHFWDDLGNPKTSQAALHALAPHAVEYVALTHQVAQRLSSEASNPVSAFWQRNTFRAEAGDLAPLLYGYDQHEMAIGHHKSLQLAAKRRAAATPRVTLA